MFGTVMRKAAASGLSTAGRRRSRRIAIEVAPLESRSLLSTVSPITVTESVSPQAKVGGRGQPLGVQVSGTVADSDTGATLNRSLAYTVLDTTTGHQIRTGTAMIAGGGDYAFNVRLATRNLGRHHSSADQFTITVTATDNAGNSGTASDTVAVAPNGGHSGRGRFHGRHNGSSGAVQSNNSISVPGNNDTVTQDITNYETKTYNITITNNNTNTNSNNRTTTTTNNINTPPPPPPGPPAPPAPPPGPPAPPAPAPGPPAPPAPPHGPPAPPHP